MKLSPAAIGSKPHDCSARTVVSLDSGQRMRMPAIRPSAVMSSSLQKMVGHPSFSMSGLANWVNVSLMMMTCICERSSSKNSLAPGSGSMAAMVRWISGRPRPCSASVSRRKAMSLS